MSIVYGVEPEQKSGEQDAAANAPLESVSRGVFSSARSCAKSFGKTMKTFADNLLAFDYSQSLRLGLRAWTLPSLRRFFGLGCVLDLAGKTWT